VIALFQWRVRRFIVLRFISKNKKGGEIMKTNRSLVGLITILISYALILTSMPPMCAEETTAAPKSNLKMLPSDTVGIVHISNMPKSIAGIKQSLIFKSAEKFFTTEAFKNFVAKHPEAGTTKDLVLSIIDALPKTFPGELTGALLTIDKEKKRPDIIVLGDANEKELNGMINTLVIPAIKNLHGPALTTEKLETHFRFGIKDKAEDNVYYAVDAGKMLLMPCEWTPEKLKSAKPLSEDSVFKATMEKLGSAPEGLIYINLKNALKLGEVREGNKFLSISGFGNVAGIAVSTRAVKNGAVGELTLYAPEGITGVLSLLTRQTSMPSIEKYVPQNYSFFIRLSVGDFGDFYKETLALLKKNLGEDSRFIAGLNDGIKEIEKTLEMSFEKDVLGSFGGQIGFALKVPKVLGVPEIAAFAEIKDKAKIEKIAKKILPEEIKFSTTEYKGITINTTAVEMFQPSYAFVDNLLVVGIGPAIIKDIIDTKESGKSLLTKEDYKTVFANLPQKSSLVAYHDTKETLELILPFLQERLQQDFERSQRIREMSNEREKEFVKDKEAKENEKDVEEKANEPDIAYDQGRELGFACALEIINILQVTTQNVSGAGFVLTGDEKSINIKQYSGLGGVGVFGVAIGAGLLLPALQRAREQARRAKSLSNLKQIGLGMKQYALDNNEVFPEKLSVLYPDYMSALSVFKHPSSRNPQISKAEDIDKFADYEIFPGLTEADPSDFIIAYEKEGLSHGEGRHVVYLDGSARWMNEESFEKAIKEQKEKMKNPRDEKEEEKE
jgi:hypothetical protein